MERQEMILRGLLEPLPPAEMLSFDYHFSEATRQIYRPDLRAAAWLCMEFTNEEAFQAFTDWAVAQGPYVHATLCEHPAQLPDVLRELSCGNPHFFPYAEEMGSVAHEPYINCTGAEMRPHISSDGPWLWCSDFCDEDAMLLMPELWQRYNREQIYGLDFTQEEWRSCNDLVSLLTLIIAEAELLSGDPPLSNRCRFACACCRHLAPAV